MENEETNEGENASEGSPDSAPFRAMIARAEAAEAELATFKQEAADAELAAQQLRSDALDEIVNALEIPNLKDDLLRWVEGDVTEASVVAALEAKGFHLTGTEPTQEVQQPEAPASPPPLIPVSTLGQQVADAASGQAQKTLDQQIAEAQTPAEIAELMNQAGASVDYT
jgi:hypothetical protein